MKSIASSLGRAILGTILCLLTMASPGWGGGSDDEAPDAHQDNGPVVLRRPWAETHKEALVRYVRALGAAFTFIRDPAKRSSVIKTIVETTGSTEAVAKQTLGLFFEPERGVLPKKAEINLKGLEQVIAFMGEAGNLKPPLPAAERFVDFQYLHAAGVK